MCGVLPETYITAMISQIKWKDSYLKHERLGRIGQIEEKSTILQTSCTLRNEVQSCAHLVLPWVKAFERQKYSWTSISPVQFNSNPLANLNNLHLPSNLTYTRITLDNSNRFSSPMGVSNIDIDLYNVAHIFQIEERTILCAYLVHWEEKEYSNHAMPINLWRSKFHSGTRFFSTLFFWKNCTSCPVEGTQQLA